MRYALLGRGQELGWDRDAGGTNPRNQNLAGCQFSLLPIKSRPYQNPSRVFPDTCTLSFLQSACYAGPTLSRWTW